MANIYIVLQLAFETDIDYSLQALTPSLYLNLRIVSLTSPLVVQSPLQSIGARLLCLFLLSGLRASATSATL